MATGINKIRRISKLSRSASGGLFMAHPEVLQEFFFHKRVKILHDLIQKREFHFEDVKCKIYMKRLMLKKTEYRKARELGTYVILSFN